MRDRKVNTIASVHFLLLFAAAIALPSALCEDSEITPNRAAWLLVEPVICRSSAGTEPAVSRIDRKAIEAVYAQAKIQIAWLQPRYLDHSEARDGTVNVDEVVRIGRTRGLWGSGPPRLSLIFVNAINGKKGPRGLGMTPGPICFVAMPKKQTNPEMEAFVVAHEIGHCLGLIHAVDDPEVPDDKPNIMGDGDFSERIGKNALMPAHIRRVRRSTLLLWPSDTANDRVNRSGESGGI